MAALTGFRPTEVYGGAPDGVLPTRYYVPVAANVTIYGGALVVIDSSGNAGVSNTYTIMIPHKSQSIFDIILGILQSIFGWVGNVGFNK